MTPREGRGGWQVLRKLSLQDLEAALPALDGRNVESSIGAAPGSGLLPARTAVPAAKRGRDYPAGVEKPWYHPMVEDSHSLPAGAATPALLRYLVFPVKLPQSAAPAAVPSPTTMAAGWTA